MTKPILSLLVASLLTAIAAGTPVRVCAAEKAAPPAKAEKKKGANVVPFQGKISALDKIAMTITLEGKEKNRTISVTSKTKIMKAGKPATFDDARVGEEVAGQLRNTDGKLEASSLRLGPKPEKAKPEKTKPEKAAKKEKKETPEKK